jgi:hypothetical protein
MRCIGPRHNVRIGMVAREKPGPPMTLANMRKNGVRAVIATCQGCGHKADVNVDALPETITVPDVGRCLRCSPCGGKRIDTETRVAYEMIEFAKDSQKKPRAS